MRCPVLLAVLPALLLGAPVRESSGQADPRSVAAVSSTDLSSRLEATLELLQPGRHDLPLYRLLREALDSGDTGLVWDGRDRYLRVDLFARDRIRGMDAAGRHAWRRFAEPEVAAFLRAAGSPVPRDALLAAVARYPDTRGGARASLDLADRFIEEGAFGQALDAVEEALSWTLDKEDAQLLRRREAFLKRRLGFRSAVGRGPVLREDSGNGMRLVASFGRFQGKAASPRPASAVPSVPRMFLTPRAVFSLEPHRVVEFPLGPRGALRGSARVLRFAATLQEAASFGGRLFAVSRAETRVGTEAGRRRTSASNLLFALEPGRNQVLWSAGPWPGTDRPRLPPVFVSGPVAWGADLAAVVAVAGTGGAQDLSLVLWDPATGERRGALFLFVGAPEWHRSRPSTPPLSWSLFPRGDELFACDGRSAILGLDRRGVRWIRSFSASYRARAPNAPAAAMAIAAGRLLAAPPGASSLLNLRARDGTRLGSCPAPPIRQLTAGRGAEVWVQGEAFVARVDAGGPAPRFLFRRDLGRTVSGPAFRFGSLFVVPTSRRLVMVGSSGAFVRSLVVRGPPAAFEVLDDRLFRVRGRFATAFRIPRSGDELALCALPFISEAPPARALEILWPWLEAEERSRRIWASGFLRSRLGPLFDFDPDAPPDARRRSLEAMAKRYRQ